MARWPGSGVLVASTVESLPALLHTVLFGRKLLWHGLGSRQGLAERWADLICQGLDVRQKPWPPPLLKQREQAGEPGVLKRRCMWRPLVQKGLLCHVCVQVWSAWGRILLEFSREHGSWKPGD